MCLIGESLCCGSAQPPSLGPRISVFVPDARKAPSPSTGSLIIGQIPFTGWGWNKCVRSVTETLNGPEESCCLQRCLSEGSPVSTPSKQHWEQIQMSAGGVWCCNLHFTVTIRVWGRTNAQNLCVARAGGRQGRDAVVVVWGARMSNAHIHRRDFS